MRPLFLLCLMIFLWGCAGDSDPVSQGDNNVIIALIFPADPLVESIVSYQAIVTADDIIMPGRQSALYSPVSSQIDTVAVYSPPGMARTFTMHFLRNDDGIIFWGRGRADVSAENATQISINISQAASGSATRVKIFRDNLPWNSDALEVVLAGFGLTPGPGEFQYQVIASAAIDSVSLSAGEDLIIIANDQGQEFYDNYRESQPKIENFISGGGTILWEACDLGWAGGSIEQAGLTLPGGLEISPGYQTQNFLTSSLWHLTSGLDSSLQGNYASHEGFFSLPDGAVEYTVDGRGLPTLVSFSLGIGWVIISGQPLEYSFNRSDSLDTGRLLANIIGHLLDRPEPGLIGAGSSDSQAYAGLSSAY